MIGGRGVLALRGGTPVVQTPERRLMLVGARARRAVSRHLAASSSDALLLSDHEGTGVVAEFERAFCDAVGAKHAVASASGTGALISILRAMGVAAGDEVIVSSYGWGSTVGAVLAVGATPRFADIDATTACIDVTSTIQMINARTRVILATHMFGNPADVHALEGVASAHGVRLVFDAAQAMGASVNMQLMGTFGDAVAWSCGRYKLPYAGEGGVVTTNDHSIADKLVVVSQHPSRARREVLDPELRPLIDEMTLSLRMHPLAAVLGSAGLEDVPELIANRRCACDVMRSRLEDHEAVSVIAANEPAISAWYSFPLTIPEGGWSGIPGAVIAAALRAEGVPIESGPVRIPLHARPRWAGAHVTPTLAVSERRCREEYVIASATRWLNVPTRRLQEIGDAFERVFSNLASLEGATAWRTS